MDARAERVSNEPTLEAGVTILLTDQRSTAPHQVVIDCLREGSGHVLWIDARDTASTYVLYDLAPDKRLLSEVEIARAWTAYQHHELVRSLAEQVTSRTQLLVLPNVCTLYQDDDIDAAVGNRLLTGTLETVGELTRTTASPVLLTAPPGERSTLTATADTMLRDVRHLCTDETIRMQRGSHDWRQTTLPTWVRRRGEQRGPSPLAKHRVRERQATLGHARSA